MVLMIFCNEIGDDFNEFVDILEMAIFIFFFMKFWKFENRKINENLKIN